MSQRTDLINSTPPVGASVAEGKCGPFAGVYYYYVVYCRKLLPMFKFYRNHFLLCVRRPCCLPRYVESSRGCMAYSFRDNCIYVKQGFPLELLYDQMETFLVQIRSITAQLARELPKNNYQVLNNSVPCARQKNVLAVSERWSIYSVYIRISGWGEKCI